MNLTERPPRSARVRIGGYVLLARMLDKCRAELAGTNGDYNYNCPLDQYFLEFAGIDAEELKAEVAKELGDGEVLKWVEKHSSNQPSDWQIDQWSAFRESTAPDNNGSRAFVCELVSDAGAAAREDIATWFEMLDVDDFASYGGKV